MSVNLLGNGKWWNFLSFLFTQLTVPFWSTSILEYPCFKVSRQCLSNSNSLSPFSHSPTAWFNGSSAKKFHFKWWIASLKRFSGTSTTVKWSDDIFGVVTARIFRALKRFSTRAPPLPGRVDSYGKRSIYWLTQFKIFNGYNHYTSLIMPDREYRIFNER